MLAAMVQHGDALKHALAELLRPGGVLHVTCSAPPRSSHQDLGSREAERGLSIGWSSAQKGVLQKSTRARVMMNGSSEATKK